MFFEKIKTASYQIKSNNMLSRQYVGTSRFGRNTKGQLISKCLFGIFNSPKNPTKKFDFTTIERTYNCETSSFGCKVSRRKAVLLQ